MLNSVRSVIRFLQVYPLVTSIVFVIDVILDVLGIYVTEIIDVFFGVSLFSIVCFWVLARKLKVSIWSRVLYATLTVVLFVDLIDIMHRLQMNAVMFDRVIFTILATGAISSLLTYIYTKYKSQ